MKQGKAKLPCAMVDKLRPDLATLIELKKCLAPPTLLELGIFYQW